MVKQSPKGESLGHSAIGALAFGGGAAGVQYMYGNSINGILLSGVAQGALTVGNGYINLRIYNLVKKKVFEIIGNSRAAFNTGRSISSLETFLVTYIVQELANADGSIQLWALYGLVTFFGLKIYEDKILKG